MNEYFYICFWGMVGDSLGPCESNLEASQDPSLRPLGQEIGHFLTFPVNPGLCGVMS